MPPKKPTSRVDLPLVGGGTLAARVTVLDRGCVRFVVRGPHIRGTFVLIPEHLRDETILPSTLRVQFGDGTGGCAYYEHRHDEPVVHGVPLHGWTGGIDPDAVSEDWFLGKYAASLRPNGVHRQLTSTVSRRTEATIRTLIEHWRQLPRYPLLLAAALPNLEFLASHENELAAEAEAEVARLEVNRASTRQRVNVLTGIRRRAQTPIRDADPAPVRLPLADRRGRPLGFITVREVAVDEDVAGTVVYEVHGARVHGRFTVGRNILRPQPLPEGIFIAYGHARQKHFEYVREHEPTVNGVPLNGHWDHRRTDDITASAPDSMPSRVRLTRTTGHSAPDATARRASAVMRALALHYLSRPDVEALRLAAAKEEAPFLLSETRRALREMRREQTAAEQIARRHRAREDEYRALAPAGARPEHAPPLPAAA